MGVASTSTFGVRCLRRFPYSGKQRGVFLLIAYFLYDSKLTLSCSNVILDGEVTGLREQGKFEEKYKLPPYVCG
jgi:hypothetical protein